MKIGSLPTRYSGLLGIQNAESSTWRTWTTRRNFTPQLQRLGRASELQPDGNDWKRQSQRFLRNHIPLGRLRAGIEILHPRAGDFDDVARCEDRPVAADRITVVLTSRINGR